MLEHAIQIDGGTVRGVADENGSGTVFRGIPFAAPPTGARRWMPPAPVVPWDGVRLCDRFGSAAIQPMMQRNALMALFGFAEPPECGISEDCLYLNVWTAADGPGEKRPVIVWIHGGGNRVGAASNPCSNGHNLSRRGAVVVSANYRLGAAGFLAHPELTREQGTSGNYAGLDLIATLEWVQRNIAQFGGDPDCVTIVGQSAGAGHVQSLMSSPLAKGLFHRAVGLSGGRFDAEPFDYRMETLEQAEAKAMGVLGKAGLNDLETMRNYPIDLLGGPRNFWNVIVNGGFLTAKSRDTFAAGGQNDVPFLAGFTADEAAPFPDPAQWTRGGLVESLRQNFGDGADRVLAAYPVDDDADARRVSYQLRTEGGFSWQVWEWAKLHSRTATAPTWLTRFEHPISLPRDARFAQPEPPGGFGAFHGVELFYYFDTLDKRPDLPWTDEDRTVADTCAETLLAFARTGAPHTPRLPDWPVFDEANGTAQHMGPRPSFGPLEEQPRLALFSELFTRLAPPSAVTKE